MSQPEKDSTIVADTKHSAIDATTKLHKERVEKASIDNILEAPDIAIVYDCIMWYTKDVVGHISTRIKADCIEIYWCDDLCVKQCGCPNCKDYVATIFYVNNNPHKVYLCKNTNHICSDTCENLASLIPVLSTKDWGIKIKLLG